MGGLPRGKLGQAKQALRVGAPKKFVAAPGREDDSARDLLV